MDCEELNRAICVGSRSLVSIASGLVIKCVM